jgi:2-dehydro-3-deoxyphosphogluconate aldolase/(4S)-4-hydroxy-2-oxoglutarate aldolase
LYDSGVRLIEWTNRADNALDNFIYLKKNVISLMPELRLGAGTIKTAAQAGDYITAGADFIISPAMIEQVGEIALANNILWIPGCMTPTEIAKAEMIGATVVKIFPSNVLGPSFVKSAKEVFPGMMFMPTGGIETNKSHLKQWFDAGVIAVGMGSTLISKSLIDEKDFSALTNDTKLVLSHIKEIKHNE